MKAEDKLAALRQAGFNVDNLFSIKGADGYETIGRLENGSLSIVDENDPIFDAILDGGTINNPALFRRWVMAQMFHIMALPISFDAAMRKKGSRYMWKMLREELRVQTILFERDADNFQIRNAWFGKDVIVEIAKDFRDQFEDALKQLKRRSCKGLKYIKLGSKNIFESDICSKLIMPLLEIIRQLEYYADNSNQVYKQFCALFEFAKKYAWSLNLPVLKTFIDAYKGVGAYYTMQNLILFHDARFANYPTEIGSVNYLNEINCIHAEDGLGWRMFGALKQLLSDNNIDIRRKMAAWRK